MYVLDTEVGGATELNQQAVLGDSHKEKSGNCASLQLWAYVSIGRNTLAPRLTPSLTRSFALSSLPFPPSFSYLHHLMHFWQCPFLLCWKPPCTAFSCSLIYLITLSQIISPNDEGHWQWGICCAVDSGRVSRPQKHTHSHRQTHNILAWNDLEGIVCLCVFMSVSQSKFTMSYVCTCQCTRDYLRLETMCKHKT